MASQRCREGQLWALLTGDGDRLVSLALQKTPVFHLRHGGRKSHQPCRGLDDGETGSVRDIWVHAHARALALLCGGLNCVPQTAFMSQTPGVRM